MSSARGSVAGEQSRGGGRGLAKGAAQGPRGTPAEGGRGGTARLAGGGVRGSPRMEVGEGPPGRKTEEAREELASVKRRTKGSGGAGHGRSSTMGKKGAPSRRTRGRERLPCVVAASSPIPPNIEGRGSVLRARGWRCSEYRFGMVDDFQFQSLSHPNSSIWCYPMPILIREPQSQHPNAALGFML